MIGQFNDWDLAKYDEGLLAEFRVNVTMRQFNEWAHEVELLGGSIEARKRLGL